MGNEALIQRRMSPESHRMFPKSHRMFPESGQLLTESEETVASWEMKRSFSAPAVLVPALPLATDKYLLDVRLDPSKCRFLIERNGDIPLRVDWMVTVCRCSSHTYQ